MLRLARLVSQFPSQYSVSFLVSTFESLLGFREFFLLWEAISFKSGTNARLMIKTAIAMIEVFDRWLRMKIFMVEIID